MDENRWLACICCSISLSLGGCSANGTHAPDDGAAGSVESPGAVSVVQVETVTTVQSSAGSFLSPTPYQLVPAYVERNAAAMSAAEATQQERAKIDVALLFRGAGTNTENQPLNAELTLRSDAPWSAVEHYFPHLEQSAAYVRWPLTVSSLKAGEPEASTSSEWLGWQDFRGLGVQAQTPSDELRAPAATLDFEARGLASPLVLSAAGDSLIVTNRSTHAVTRALLVYSHPGGVGVTAIGALDPGARTVTLLGPKERPAGELLDRARVQLTEFFGAAVGAELASTMAAAKSIPFLETQGMRLIALLDEELEPVVVSFSSSVSSQRRVLVSHSEILKPEEEARVLELVKDQSLNAEQALTSLGRFTRAKLEYAEQSSDPSVTENARTLLRELQAR